MNRASSKSEGRWLWVPPTLILVGFAAFGVAQLIPDKEQHPNRQEQVLARASAVCEAHVPAEHQMGIASPMTAREVVAAAHFLRKPAGPWDQLPGDHFVARCSYSSTAATGTSPTTICRGEIFSLYRPTQILVDENGRTSPDYGFESLPPPC